MTYSSAASRRPTRQRYNAGMRDAMFGLGVAIAVSLGTGIAAGLLVLVAIVVGVAP